MDSNRQSLTDNSYEYLAISGTSKQQPENEVHVNGNDYFGDTNNTFRAPLVKSTSENSQKIIVNDNGQSSIDNSYEYFSIPGTSKQQPENEVHVNGNDYFGDTNNTFRAPLVKEHQPLQQQQGEYEYKDIQEYTEHLLTLKQELTNGITKNPILWCNVGSYYSSHCQKILSSISSDLESLATIQNIDENHNDFVNKRKIRLLKRLKIASQIFIILKKAYNKIDYYCKRYDVDYYYYCINYLSASESYALNNRYNKKKMSKVFINSIWHRHQLIKKVRNKSEEIKKLMEVLRQTILKMNTILGKPEENSN